VNSLSDDPEDPQVQSSEYHPQGYFSPFCHFLAPFQSRSYLMIPKIPKFSQVRNLKDPFTILTLFLLILSETINWWSLWPSSPTLWGSTGIFFFNQFGTVSPFSSAVPIWWSQDSQVDQSEDPQQFLCTCAHVFVIFQCNSYPMIPKPPKSFPVRVSWILFNNLTIYHQFSLQFFSNDPKDSQILSSNDHQGCFQHSDRFTLFLHEILYLRSPRPQNPTHMIRKDFFFTIMTLSHKFSVKFVHVWSSQKHQVQTSNEFTRILFTILTLFDHSSV
jgi:hypothetical protein